MPSENTKILEFNKYQQYDKASFIIYADLECSLEKTDGCKNSRENSFTTKAGEHIAPGFSMFTITLFRIMENKHGIYRGKYCMISFCESLREPAMDIIN